MKSRIFQLLVMLCAVLMPGPAIGEPQDAHLRWFQVAHPGSCLAPIPVKDGDTFFEVNSLPIPTWLQSTTGRIGDTRGRRTSIMEAPFRTSIFRVGKNEILFHVVNSSGSDACNANDNKITLHAPAFGENGLLLFNVPMYGTPGNAVTEIELDLEQIDPDLADSIEELLDMLERQLGLLDDFGPNADQAARDRAQLEQLLDDLQELIDRGFDQIDPAELDVLLTEYADVAKEVLEALKQVVKDFKTAIEDLRSELDRLSGNLNDRLSDLDDFSSNGPDFGDSDFSKIDNDTLPDVDVPGQGDDPWDESNDIYDEYATQTIALLSDTLADDGATVLERMPFLEIFNAWRVNITAMEAALQARAVVSQEEFGAFLRAKGRVLDFVEPWIDDRGWFKDRPIPDDTKELVDRALASRDPVRANRIKLALNVMPLISDAENAAIFGLLFVLKEIGLAFEAAKAARLEQLQQELLEKEDSMWDSTVSFLGSVASVGWDAAVTITPLGDLIDICEAVSGKAGCNLTSGRDLSYAERGMAAVGMFMVGSSSSLRKLANKLDKIKCPIGGSAAPHIIFAGPIKCSSKRFFGRFERAMNAVKRRSPGADKLSGEPIKSASGTTYKAKSIPPVGRDAYGVTVTYNKRGFVMFEPRHMKRVTPPKRNEVYIDYLCHRVQEISDANFAAGFPRGAHGVKYTWHHSHKFRTNQSTGRVQILMQLVNRDVHEFASHSGGHAIGKQIVGAANCM